MLKKLILKNQELSVPIPILTLGEAIHWVEGTFLRNDAVLTSAILEDKELINELYRKSIKDIKLQDHSRLQIKIETPKDLSNQSLDVVCDLAYGISTRIKRMDLESWHENESAAKPLNDLEEIHSDLKLLLDLITHINGLGEVPSYLSSINRLSSLLTLETFSFERLLAKEQWLELARLLLKLMEPHLRDLAREGETLQLSLLSGGISFVAAG